MILAPNAFSTPHRKELYSIRTDALRAKGLTWKRRHPTDGTDWRKREQSSRSGDSGSRGESCVFEAKVETIRSLYLTKIECGRIQLYVER